MPVERASVPADRAVLETAVVPEDGVARRLDRAAADLLMAFPTRASARKAALRGELAVDGVISEPARWVAAGDVIAQLEPTGGAPPVLRVAVTVVYEDDDLAIVVKPPGIATSGPRRRTLERALPFSVRSGTGPDALRWPRCVHRLDAPTSGLVVVAKTRTAHAALGVAFQERRVHKRYRAVVVGRLDGEGKVETPIDGRSAVTRYAVVDHARSLKSQWISVVDLWPETGRTHQLRKHLAELGTPILGDLAYGIEGLKLRHKGLFLFALALRFAHPRQRTSLSFVLEPPPKVASLLAREARRWRRYHAPEGEAQSARGRA